MANLDEKDCVILNALQENCRLSLTNLAKKVNLSIDSVKKRLNKLKDNDIFYPSIKIRPRSLGFNHIADIKIKLNSHSQKDIGRFINYLMNNPKIVEVFTVSGEWDLSIVVISRDATDFDNVTSEIKNKFGNMINSWSESMTLKAFKFEKYDMKKLLSFGK